MSVVPKFKSKKYQETIDIYYEPTGHTNISAVEVDFIFYLNGERDHCGRDIVVWRHFAGEEMKIIKIYSAVNLCTGYDSLLLDVHKGLEKELDKKMDDWHKAAAEANLSDYFAFMGADFFFLGTDPGERWSKKEFLEFCKPHFEKSPAWEFTKKERNFYFAENDQVAWFDEILNTWMMDCRGTGVIRRNIRGEWKLMHYSLSVLIENEKVDDFIKLRKVE